MRSYSQHTCILDVSSKNGIFGEANVAMFGQPRNREDGLNQFVDMILKRSSGGGWCC